LLKSLHRSLECITLAKEFNKLKHKTMTTTIYNNEETATTTITKTINAKTPKGNDIQISVYHRILEVTDKPFKSKNYFSLSYNGNNSIGHNDMDKESLNYFIKFIDKYSHKL
jgi:hypothetical protein